MALSTNSLKDFFAIVDFMDGVLHCKFIWTFLYSKTKRDTVVFLQHPFLHPPDFILSSDMVGKRGRMFDDFSKFQN